MDDDPLRCDGCSRESWPDGSLLLEVHEDHPEVMTVKGVRVSCGAKCASTADAREANVVICDFGKIDDVFDYADRLIAAHDWERGTVQRLSRVLAAVHRKRVPGTEPTP